VTIALLSLGIALDVALVVMVWRASRRYVRALVELKRAIAKLPPLAGAVDPPADVLARRLHTAEQKAEFDARLKQAHEDFHAQYRERFERTLRGR
jgi:hypothetical protein